MSDTESSSQVTVFISYSWDSPEHKEWVAKFATALRAQGIEVILDQWDLGFGDDVALFMEKSVRDAHRVLIICTQEYVRKADAGQGGVGYERMIVTSELVKNIGTNKFVPVIRSGDEKNLTPSFLSTRKYADLRDDKSFDPQVKDLAAALKNEKVTAKPPLAQTASSSSPALVVAPLPPATDDPVEAYNTAISLVRSDDIFGWRKFVQKLKASKSVLNKWREKYDDSPPHDLKELHEAVDEAIKYISPLIMTALAGVESEKEKFNDQRALFDEFYHITEWNRSGRTILVELPETLGFIYQGLHGAVCMHTTQLELAYKFAVMNIGFGGETKIPLWRHHGVVGWPESLGRTSTEVWKYLSNAFGRWPWLKEIFGSEEEYKISLISYYIMLSFIEYAQTLRDIDLSTVKESLSLDVPLNFTMEADNLREIAIARLAKKPEIFGFILSEFGIDKKRAVEMWPKWMEVCNFWTRQVFHWSRNRPYEDFLKYLGWVK